MPSKYLFLSHSQKSVAGASWINLPTLSQSSRECYLTMVSAKLVFDTNAVHEGINLKMDIPVMNYASSDNDIPMVAMLEQGTDTKIYHLPTGNDIHLLTNDNLKNINITTEDNFGNVLTLAAGDSLEIMLKLDYIEQQDIAKDYLAGLPKHLGGL